MVIKEKSTKAAIHYWIHSGAFPALWDQVDSQINPRARIQTVMILERKYGCGNIKRNLRLVSYYDAK